MSVDGYGQALYYPYLEFKDDNWFKTAALYYEGLRRIVPKEYDTNDTAIVKKLNEECDFVQNYDPKNEAQSVVNDFYHFLQEDLNNDNIRTPLMREIKRRFPSGQVMKIHKNKLSELILSDLTRSGDSLPISKREGDWVYVDAPVAALYMTCLANKIAERNKFHIVTDAPAYQPLIHGLQQDFRGAIPTNIGHRVNAMVIETVVPKKIESISIEQISEFRDEYKLERVRYYEAVEDLVRNVPLSMDPEALNDYVEQKAIIVEANTEVLKNTLAEVKIETTNNFLAVSTPAIAVEIGDFAPNYAPWIKITGLIAVGYGIYKHGRAKYRIKKASPWSYVLYLEKKLNRKGLLQRMLGI